MSLTSPGQALPEDAMESRLMGRMELLTSYRTTRTELGRVHTSKELGEWIKSNLRLFDANAGQPLFQMLWRLQLRLARCAGAAALIKIADSTYHMCLSSGALATTRFLEAVLIRTSFEETGEDWISALAGIARLAPCAPEMAGAIVINLSTLLEHLAVGNIAAWAEDALRLYPRDRQKRLAYYRLDDPTAIERLAAHEGIVRFEVHTGRLTHLVKALFNRELKVQVVPPHTATSIQRTRLAGDVILVPGVPPNIVRGKGSEYFEAAVLHGLCHQTFTPARFPVGKMKPLQLALVSLLEDARVERLAVREWPGIQSFWLPFHMDLGVRARSAEGLLARLARALADPSHDDDDAWVQKGRMFFEAAFAATPNDLLFCERLARVLGHDLGQMRIPFDAKSYLVTPPYRDDGLGLFQIDDPSQSDEETLEILLDAARILPDEDPSKPAAPEGSDQSASIKFVEADPDKGALLGLYPEWDYRLGSETKSAVSVFADQITTVGSPSWLDDELAIHRRESGALRALLRRSRTGRTVRLKKRLDGDDIDLEAVVENLVSCHAGHTPDPRLYSVKRRLERDVSMALLVDTSQSTASRKDPTTPSVLETAVVATALLGEALSELNDPFAIFSFCSNGKDDVRLGAVKDFNEPFAGSVPRLAGLQARFSTRLGAGVRHVATKLHVQRTMRKVLIVITDGEPADRDVDDPEFLTEDARHAIAGARSAGMDLFCVVIGDQALPVASRMFGKRNTLSVYRIEDLIPRLSELYFRLTVN